MRGITVRKLRKQANIQAEKRFGHEWQDYEIDTNGVTRCLGQRKVYQQLKKAYKQGGKQ